MEETVQVTVAEAMKQVGAALTEAAKEYGPGAVDLALMAYRVDAAQQLLVGGICVVVAATVAFAYLKLWRLTDDWDCIDREHTRGIGGIVASFIGAATFLGAFASLIDASAWIAAFGYPELRIAMKALEAAGLM